jgi:hypothetical protein
VIGEMQAEAIARGYVHDLVRLGSPECVLLPDQTREESVGWLFFYQSRESVETGNASAMLDGPAPLLVLRATGELRILGTDRPVDDYLVGYRSALPKPVDPTWRLRFRALWLASIGLILVYVLSRGAGIPLLLAGAALLAFAVMAFRDVGGVGSDEAARFVFYTRAVPWQRKLGPMSLATARGYLAGIPGFMGLLFILMATGILTGVLR